MITLESDAAYRLADVYKRQAKGQKGCVRTYGRIAGALHKGRNPAFHHQPVIADNQDRVLRRAVNLLLILADHNVFFICLLYTSRCV